MGNEINKQNNLKKKETCAKQNSRSQFFKVKTKSYIFYLIPLKLIYLSIYIYIFYMKKPLMNDLPPLGMYVNQTEKKNYREESKSIIKAKEVIHTIMVNSKLIINFSIYNSFPPMFDVSMIGFLVIYQLIFLQR